MYLVVIDGYPHHKSAIQQMSVLDTNNEKPIIDLPGERTYNTQPPNNH